MEKLTEAVVNLINEDVVKGKKQIENELYSRLGVMLEEKLKDYAPTIFEAKLSPNQKKIAAKAGDPKKIEREDFAALRKEEMDESVDSDQLNLINEEYEELVDEIQAIVEEVEAESGKELSESEIEEIANLVLESYENDIDEDEFEDDEDVEEEEEE